MPLAEFAAHKEQFFAWMAPLIAVEEAQVGEFAPGVAGHFVEEALFEVHDFIVGEGEHEFFAEGVHKGEGECAVVVAAIDGVHSEVFEAVVHPAHVPFEIEAQAAIF